MGKTKGPSIGFKAFWAFFLPMVVFIISLTVFERLLVDIVIAEKFKTAISFLLSLLMTTLVMLVLTLIKLNLKK